LCCGKAAFYHATTHRKFSHSAANKRRKRQLKELLANYCHHRLSLLPSFHPGEWKMTILNGPESRKKGTQSEKRVANTIWDEKIVKEMENMDVPFRPQKQQ